MHQYINIITKNKINKYNFPVIPFVLHLSPLIISVKYVNPSCGLFFTQKRLYTRTSVHLDKMSRSYTNGVHPTHHVKPARTVRTTRRTPAFESVHSCLRIDPLNTLFRPTLHVESTFTLRREAPYVLTSFALPFAFQSDQAPNLENNLYLCR